ncbi:hypothetical protein COBT_002855, partial [Conglomerata obtusa]
MVRQKLYEKSLLRNANRVITKQAKFNNMLKHAKDNKRTKIATEHKMTPQAANIGKIRRVDHKKRFGFSNEDVLSSNLTIDRTRKPVPTKARAKQKGYHAMTSFLEKSESARQAVALTIDQPGETEGIFVQTVDDTIGSQAKGDTQATKEARQRIKSLDLRDNNEREIQVKPTNKRKLDPQARCLIRNNNDIKTQDIELEHKNHESKFQLAYVNASKTLRADSSCDPVLEIHNGNQSQLFDKLESPSSMHLQDSSNNEDLDLNTETIWTEVLETMDSNVTNKSKHGSSNKIEKNTQSSNALQSCIMLNSETTEGFNLINIKDNSLFKHHIDNLKMVHKVLKTDQNMKKYSYRYTFIAKMIEHYEKLKNIYTDVKEIEFTINEDVIIYDQDENYIAISYINFIKLSHCYDVEKLCKENMLFYSNLNIFVDEEFLKKDFTFNNLYALIIQKVQTVRIDVYTEKEFNYLKHILYKILKQSSRSTMLYFFEIPKLLSYLETRNFDELAYNIDDVGVYFAILNVFNTLIAKNWSSMIKNCVSPNYKNINLTDINKIVENEKHRQIFYKILLYVVRPFVSVKRYQEVWSKNICQDLVVMHLRENWNKKDIAANCYSKLVYYQLYEIFAFEIDTVNNVLINKTDDDNSIYKAVKYMINHNNFSNLKAKLGQKIFFQRLQLIISCILKYLKSNEKRNDEEIGISKSYIDYFSHIINNTIDFKQVSFTLQIPNNHLNFFTGNVLINRNNETWYQQLDYYNNLYLV